MGETFKKMGRRRSRSRSRDRRDRKSRSRSRDRRDRRRRSTSGSNSSSSGDRRKDERRKQVELGDKLRRLADVCVDESAGGSKRERALGGPGSKERAAGGSSSRGESSGSKVFGSRGFSEQGRPREENAWMSHRRGQREEI